MIAGEHNNDVLLLFRISLSHKSIKYCWFFFLPPFSCDRRNLLCNKFTSLLSITRGRRTFIISCMTWATTDLVEVQKSCSSQRMGQVHLVLTRKIRHPMLGAYKVVTSFSLTTNFWGDRVRWMSVSKFTVEKIHKIVVQTIQIYKTSYRIFKPNIVHFM